LAGVGLFEGLSRADLKRLARSTEEVEVPAGTVLARQMERGDAMFLVIKGRVTVRRGTRRISDIGPGGVFGELALIDGLPRSATVAAAEDSTVLVVPRSEFQGLLVDRPPVARKLLKILSLKLRETDRRLLG
jgi:CRP-like cAMP-binding protein